MRETIEDIMSSGILLGLVAVLAVYRRKFITMVFRQSPLWMWFILLGICLVQIPGAFLWPNQVYAPWFIIRGQASVVLVVVCELLVCLVLGYRLHSCQHARLRRAIAAVLIFLLGATAAAVPAYFWNESRAEQIETEERAVGALIVAEMHARAFEAFLSKTNLPPVARMEALVIDGLRVHKELYEGLRQEGILSPANGFTRGYDKTCTTLEELERIQQPDRAVTQESAPSVAP